MSDPTQLPSEKAQQNKLAEQLFCTTLAYQGLRQSPEQPIIVFNDIVQLVRGNSLVNHRQVMTEINQDLTLRRTYMQLLQQFKFAESGLQAAASSGDVLPPRVTEHFSLKFKRDKHYPTQVYVILAIAHPREQHNNSAISLHITSEDQVEWLLFPKLVDGVSQLLMDDSDNTFKLLIDPNSQLFLM